MKAEDTKRYLAQNHVTGDWKCQHPDPGSLPRHLALNHYTVLLGVTCKNEAAMFSGRQAIPKAYPIGDSVPGEDGPGLPIHIVAVLPVHMFPQTIHVGTRQPDGELQELVSKQEGPNA